jgi:dihydroflavonol-4-reductase
MSAGITVALTGSSGHLATSVVPLLSTLGYRIRALHYNHEPAYNSENFETVKGSLSDPASLRNLVTGCDLVIHAAARISIRSRHDPSVYETNVRGTMDLFNSAKEAGVKRFIYISSIHAYSQHEPGGLLNEESKYCTDRAARYDQSKRDAQKYVLQASSGEMEVVVLIPTGIVGPPDNKPSLMGKALINIYRNKIPALVGGGFDFCDVRDVASAVVNSISKGRNRQVYLLSGNWCSLPELYELIMDYKGSNKRIPVLPVWAGYLGLPFTTVFAALKRDEPLYTKESLTTLVYGNKQISSAKAKAELAYTCRPFSETVADTISWFKQSGYLV